MKKVYEKIWKLAKKLYKKGRPMDIAHIEWMMRDAMLVCKKEKIDDTLLLPLAILHDTGYSAVPKDNPFKINLRKAHMKAGAKIACRILKQLDYPEDKIRKIEYYVSVHDNWALGDDEVFKKDIILGVFTDLDFIWMATPQGFPPMMRILNKNPKQLLEYIETDDKPIKRPFATKTTKALFEKYLRQRRKEIISSTTASRA
jgi:hypothetical protein